MAFGTKCGKCEHGYFVIKAIEPSGSAFKLMAVQCQSCGTPFAVTDFYNTGALLKAQEKTLAALAQQVSALDHKLRQLVSVLQRQ